MHLLNLGRLPLALGLGRLQEAVDVVQRLPAAIRCGVPALARQPGQHLLGHMQLRLRARRVGLAASSWDQPGLALQIWPPPGPLARLQRMRRAARAG